MKRKLLVFDSGVGGLSVVRELRRVLPDIHMDYVADDAFRPYGNKTERELQDRLPTLIDNLTQMIGREHTRPDAVVLACNTASTCALDDIRAQVNCPVIGVVPAIKPAASASKSGAIGVLGTPRTVAHQYVDDLIQKYAQQCRVVLHGSTKLVEMGEQKLRGHAVDLLELADELAPLFVGRPPIDHLVLACTHFPLLRDELQRCAKRLGFDLTLVDSGQAIARRSADVLVQLPAQSDECGRYAAYPQTAFLIGGRQDPVRADVFAQFGFEKTVCL